MSTVTEWRETRLKNLFASVRNGIWGDDPDDETDVFCARGTDFDRATNRISVAKMPRRSVTAGALRDHQLQHGDLILEKSGGSADQPVGSVAMFDLQIHAVCSNFNARMQVSSSVDPAFACYLMNSLYWSGFTRQFVKQTTGIQNLDAQALLAQRCTLPPLDEQRRIADFLDAETAGIDRAIALIMQQTQVLDERYQAVIDAEVGRIEDCIPLKYVASIVDTEHRTAPCVDGGGYWIAGTAAVRRGRIDQTALYETDRDSYQEWTRRRRARPGDVLLSREAPVGEVGLYRPEDPQIAIGQRMVLLSPERKCISGDYLTWTLLSSRTRRFIDDATQGSLHPHLNMSDIGSIPVDNLSLSGQETIVLRLSSIVGELEALSELRSAQLALLAERRQALITAAVTGQIDVTTARGLSPSGGVAV